jgi:SNF2 family DNA or RNA helicase
MYDALRDQMVAQVDDDHVIEATQALIKMTRLQQLTSGYAVVDEAAPLSIGDLITWYEPGSPEARVAPVTEIKLSTDPNEDSLFRVVEESLKIDRWFQFGGGDWVSLAPSNQKTIELFEGDTNPRLKALEAILDPITHKVIIWARFRKDIDLICRALGDAAVRYDGIVKDKDRELALHRFRTDDTVRYFVANQQSISMGVTLTQAKTVIYYSNNFALEKRLQSEDRAHRIGQDVSVNVIDMVARGTVDEHIVKTLRRKFDIAATVMGDRLREWLK